jgi:hypothetical protein
MYTKRNRNSIPCSTGCPGGLEALLNLNSLGVGESVPEDLEGKFGSKGGKGMGFSKVIKSDGKK